jgi:co-chaperonin GroES (HSP10)
MVKVLNENVLVKMNETSTMDNGIQIQETRGKRDIVSGVVVNCDEQTGITLWSKIYFPYYAAISFNLKGEELWIVNVNDVIMIEDEES